jgi:(2Fe-2S) ferredoxin
MVTVEILNSAPVKDGELTPEKAERIFQQHILGGTAVAEYALGMGSERGA